MHDMTRAERATSTSYDGGAARGSKGGPVSQENEGDTEFAVFMDSPGRDVIKEDEEFLATLAVYWNDGSTCRKMVLMRWGSSMVHHKVKIAVEFIDGGIQ